MTFKEHYGYLLGNHREEIPHKITRKICDLYPFSNHFREAKIELPILTYSNMESFHIPNMLRSTLFITNKEDIPEVVQKYIYSVGGIVSRTFFVYGNSKEYFPSERPFITLNKEYPEFIKCSRKLIEENFTFYFYIVDDIPDNTLYCVSKEHITVDVVLKSTTDKKYRQMRYPAITFFGKDKFAVIDTNHLFKISILNKN